MSPNDDLKLACFQALMESLPDQIYFKDRESRFLLVSRRMAQWCGRQNPAELIGLTDADLFAAAHAAEARADEQRLLSGERPNIIKEELETWPDGRTTWVWTIKLPWCDAAGAIQGTFGVSRDITEIHQNREQLQIYQERLEAMVADRTLELQTANQRLRVEVEQRMESERALRESEQRYRRLLASTTDYVYTVEMVNGRPASTHHGPGCIAVTGYTPEEYQRRPDLWIEMVCPEDRDRVREACTHMLAGQEVLPFEHRIQRKDGSRRWVRSTMVERRTPDGALAGYDGLVKDITDEHEAREARVRAEQDALERAVLERADRLNSLGLLAAGVAHEVNNPLQGMLSHLETVRHALPPAFPHQKSLDMVVRGIETIAGLVQRLLWLGTHEADGPERCRFDEAVRFVEDMLGRRLRLHGIQLVTRGRTLHAELPISQRELVQVLLNLFINACDAMPDGGTITLTCDAGDGRALVTVADTGPGIPPDILARIFTPFFSTKGSRGTGLGLSVAESILRAHGGAITAASRPGQGAVFTLNMPLTENRP